MKTLTKELGKYGQYAFYKETLDYKGHKLRIYIKSETYSEQCRCRIEIFNDLKWNSLASIHHTLMKTDKNLVYSMRGIVATDFAADRNELIKRAKDLI